MGAVSVAFGLIAQLVTAESTHANTTQHRFPPDPAAPARLLAHVDEQPGLWAGFIDPTQAPCVDRLLITACINSCTACLLACLVLASSDPWARTPTASRCACKRCDGAALASVTDLLVGAQLHYYDDLAHVHTHSLHA